VPRKAATIEYLERLVDWAGGRRKFCNLTGILAPNLSDYLSGNKRISWKRLQSATKHVFGQPPAFIAVVEGYDVQAEGMPSLKVLPRDPGLYALYDSAMRIIYYGKAASLYAEVRQTLSRKIAEVRPWTGVKDLTFLEITTYISAYKINRGDADYRHDLEAFGLRLLVNNTFNKKGGTFKRSD